MLAWESSGLLWVCSSNQGDSHVAILDANNPNSVVDVFPACSAHLLCVSSIPGWFLILKFQGLFAHSVLTANVLWFFQ